MLPAFPISREPVPEAAPLWWPAAGLALIIAGQPIAWWLRGTFTESDSAAFPAGAVLLGLALIMGLRPLASWQMRASPGLLMAYVCLWLLPIAALSLVDLRELGDDAGYAFFLALLALAMACVPIGRLRLLPRAVAIVSGVSCILTLSGLALGIGGDEFQRLALVGNQNQYLAGMVGGLTLFAGLLALLTTDRGAKWGLFYALLAAAALPCIILSNTRSVMLALVYTVPLAVVLVRWKRPPGPRRTRGGIAVFSMLVAGVVAATPAVAYAALGPEAVEAATELFAERFVGTVEVFNPSPLKTVDASSQMRVDVLDRTIARLTLFGHGISAQVRAEGDVVGAAIYPHLAYLQAFYDLGVLGAVVFTVLHLVIPAGLIARRLAAGPVDPGTAFLIAWAAYSHIDLLTHSTPYSWSALVPIVAVYALLARVPPGRHATAGGAG